MRRSTRWDGSDPPETLLDDCIHVWKAWTVREGRQSIRPHNDIDLFLSSAHHIGVHRHRQVE